MTDTNPKKAAQIILPSNCGNTITESAEEIFALIAPSHTVFRRAGIAMRIVELEDGRLALDVLRSDSFRSMLERFGTIFAWRADGEGDRKLKRSLCPDDMASALLSCEKINVLPPVRGVIARPVLACIDGKPKALGRGYHPEGGGLLVTGGRVPPEIGLDDACIALKLMVSDFDFATPGDRSRALASLITPALVSGQWLTGSVPADVAEADQSQSGKTYRQKLIFALYAEEPRRIARKDGGVGGMDESIGQAMLGGSPFIQIDNVRGRLDSQFVEMAITAGGMIGVRVPHRGEVQVDARHFLFFLTSNGVETTRDLANRSNIIRIRKRAGHVFATYPEGDLLAHVTANQTRFLGAVFAVIKQWHAEGCQRSAETRHDFRQWCGALDWIVQCILGEAPLMEGHADAQERVSNPALTWLRQVALAVHEEERIGEEMSASAIAEMCAERDIEMPGRETTDEESRRKQAGTLLKRAFKIATSIQIDGYKIERRELEKYVESESRYRTVKVYVVSLLTTTENNAAVEPGELVLK